MLSVSAIRAAIERTIHDMQRDPDWAKGTVHATASISDGLKCMITEGAWTLASDGPPAIGGNSEGPSPGVYGRAAITSCVAIGIKMMAARLNQPVTSVSVILDADYDWRGDFGVDDVPPGFQQFRLKINIESPADTEATEKLVAEALRVSPWLNTLVRSQLVSTEVHVTQRSAL